MQVRRNLANRSTAAATGVLLLAGLSAACKPPPPRFVCIQTTEMHGVQYGPLAVSTYTCSAGAGVISTTARLERQTATGWTTISAGSAQSTRAPGNVSSSAVQFCYPYPHLTPEVIRAVATDTALDGRRRHVYVSPSVSTKC